jgi:methylenetetrahydrofolate reductase (NADPH)
MMRATKRFSEIYAANEKILSLEFFPPKAARALGEVHEMIRDLAAYRPHYMTVTYGAGGSTRELTQELVRFIRDELAEDVVQHLTCVGHSREEIDIITETLRTMGTAKILALRGDAPRGETEFRVHPGGFSCARDLVRHLAQQRWPSVAVAGYPETHREARSREADLLYLQEKVAAGAEIVLTQLFFDPSLYFRFLEDAARAGVNVPIVPGLMPIGSASQIERFTTLCGASIPKRVRDALERFGNSESDVQQFGTDYAIEQAKALLAGGAPGIHLYTLNRSHQSRPIIQALGIGRSTLSKLPCQP